MHKGCSACAHTHGGLRLKSRVFLIALCRIQGKVSQLNSELTVGTNLAGLSALVILSPPSECWDCRWVAMATWQLSWFWISEL